MAEQDQPELEGGQQPEAGDAPQETTAPAQQAEGDHAHDEHVGVEPESVDVRPLILAAIVMAASVITIVLVVFQWSEIEFEHARVNAVELTGYPQRRELEFRAAEKLNQYGVVNPDSGVYRIPIDRAIELMVNRATAPAVPLPPPAQPPAGQ